MKYFAAVCLFRGKFISEIMLLFKTLLFVELKKKEEEKVSHFVTFSYVCIFVSFTMNINFEILEKSSILIALCKFCIYVRIILQLLKNVHENEIIPVSS